MLLVAADGVGADVVPGLADPQVTRRGGRVDRAADHVEVDVARRGLNVHAARDLMCEDVAARALDVEPAVDVLEPDVARGGGDVGAAEGAVHRDVGRLRADGETGELGRPDAAGDALPAEEEAEVEAAAPLRYVDDHLRPAVVVVQLDARRVDELLRLLVVRDQLDVDAGRAVDRLDLDLARREAYVELGGAAD